MDRLDVSIIIPAHNCRELTHVCLESIRRNTTDASYEIILIDDASDAATSAWMKGLEAPDLKVLRNEERKSYSINNNLGAAQAAGRYYCLLNNDTEVYPGWLSSMVRVADREEKLGVLGNKHLFPQNHRLHHCGMAFDAKGHPVHLYPNSDPDDSRANYQCDLQLVTFACVLIPRDVYRELNGLDEAFRNGCEDCDFCLRAGEAGYRVVYTPASVIEHHGQATPGRKAHDDANLMLLREKWQSRIVCDYDHRVEQDRQHRRRVKTGRRDRGADHGVHFAVDFSGGSAFAWASAELIKALVERGVEVSVNPVFRLHGSLEPDMRKLLRSLMRKPAHTAFHVKWSHYWPAYLRQPLAGDVNIEFFCTNYRQRPEAMPDIWLRNVQATSNRLMPISEFNRLALDDIGIPPERSAVIPLGYAPEIDRLYPDGVEIGKREKLHALVITNSHDLMRYGSDVLVKAFGQAFSDDRSIVLHIKDYGAGCDNRQLEAWIAEQPNFPEIVWHREFLSRDDLMHLYASMDLLIAPYRGEGFGMKVMDAMALGLPVLMPAFGGPTEFAPEGTFVALEHDEVPVGECYDREHFHLSDGAYWCEVKLDPFVETLRRLPSMREELRAIGKRARSHVRPEYSWPSVAAKFEQQIRVWGTHRSAVVSARSAPSELDITVIIPTKNREDVLRKTLSRYAAQESLKASWELLIVNDGGDENEVRRVVSSFEESLPVVMFNNPGSPGPAGARNAAIQRARGHIVLITGDDIIPSNHFLANHLAMHREHPNMEVAVLGQTLWSNELDTTPFMDYLTGEGGHQFAYDDLRHGRVAPYDRFYTSNISLKREFLVEEETLFHTGFRYAAYEDVELAYRLHLRGMKLLYNAEAQGYHYHMMDPASFLRRQILVGRMLTYFCFAQPAYVPEEHAIFLDACEYSRMNPDLVHTTDHEDPEAFIGEWVVLFQRQLEQLQKLERRCQSSTHRDDRMYHDWLQKKCGRMWEAINEMALRVGMAEEWAGADEVRKRNAVTWVTGLTLPSVFKKSEGEFYHYCVTKDGNFFVKNPILRMAILAYQRAMYLPVVGKGLQAFQRSRFFTMCKQCLLKKS